MSRIVLSAPPAFRKLLAHQVPSAVGTFEALRGLFRSAGKTLKIFSPFVDASFNELIREARCPVRIVTTALQKRGPKCRSVLERSATHHNIAIRYVSEVQGGAQMFQMHAKTVIADGRTAYLGSANLTDTSLNYNLELGLLLTDPRVVAEIEMVFNVVYERLGVPARML